MSSGRRYLLFLAGLAALTGLLLALGYLPTRSAGGRPALAAMLLACGVSFVGSAVGGLPIALARSGGVEGLKLFMVSMISRLLVVALLAGAVVLVAAPPRNPFLIWLGASYLVLLVADSSYAWASLRRL